MRDNNTHPPFLDRRPARRTIGLALMLISVFFAKTGAANTDDTPTVIMLEVPGITPNDDALYEAIRAQLSASPLRLARMTIDDAQSFAARPLDRADGLADDRSADILFWISVEGTQCTIFFFDKHAKAHRIFKRVLDLSSENPLSRSDTIANAASSVIEESISGIDHERVPPAPKPPSGSTPPPPPPARKPRPAEVTLFATYSGSYFARRLVTHGGRLGLEFLSLEHVAIALSYTQTVPAKRKTSQYQLTLTSRHIEAGVAWRRRAGFVDFRLGALWSLDLRSYQTDAYSDTIAPRPANIVGIHSLAPFAAAIWLLSDRVGISTELAAPIAINEKSYLILQDGDRDDVVLTPHRAKLTYRVGLIVYL